MAASSSSAKSPCEMLPQDVPRKVVAENVYNGFEDAVGNTPLIYLRRASEATGCRIYGKAEYLNPGGSVKDRAALWIVRNAEKQGLLTPGQPGTIVEGTAGNTGIGIALVANARGYKTVIVIPDTQSQEKKDMLRLAGAELVEVPAVPYRNPNNYIKWSGRLAAELGAVWANQFDNTANRQAHVDSTGPEIWAQTDGKIDAFSCAVGTGGTISGMAEFLRSKNPNIKIALTDPRGASLHRYYTEGELRAEGSSITEGIGQARITAQLQGFRPDYSFEITDEEAVTAVYDLLRFEGLCVGTSSGINVAGAVRLARELGPGHTIVTVLCDWGTRYQSKLFNPAFMAEKNLPRPEWLESKELTPPVREALERARDKDPEATMAAASAAATAVDAAAAATKQP